MVRKREGLDGVDEHIDRVAIERALIRSRPNIEGLAKRYGLSRDCLYRHRRKLKQIAPARFRAMLAEDWSTSPDELERLRVETRGGWLKGIRAHHAKLTLALDNALEEGDRAGVSRISGQINKCFELIGQGVGELEGHGTHVNTMVILSPALMRVRESLMAALRPYPEARQAAITALEASEQAIEAEPLMIEAEAA